MIDIDALVRAVAKAVRSNPELRTVLTSALAGAPAPDDVEHEDAELRELAARDAAAARRARRGGR